MAGYRELFDASIEDARAFWADAAQAVTWTHAPYTVLDDSSPPFYRWFPDGELNTCASALDRHVEQGSGEQAALIYDSPLAGTTRTYMPMVPEAVIAMLASARLGAVHSVLFGGFAAHELAARIDDARPAVVVSASCGIEPTRIVDYKSMVDTALELAEHTTPACVILQRDQAPCDLTAGRDVSWTDAMADADPSIRFPWRRPIRSTCSTPPARPASRWAPPMRARSGGSSPNTV